MDTQPYHRLLYKNSSITLLESYVAIEKFLLSTRLSFLDQYQLFDLLHRLLPHEENQLTCQGFLSWLVWRVDQYQERPMMISNRSTQEYPSTLKRFRADDMYCGMDGCNDRTLIDSTQQQQQQQQPPPPPSSSDLQEQIDRLQSIVLRLASNIETLNHQSDRSSSPPMNLQMDIKQELIEENEPSEQEDELSDVNHRLDFPASTSNNLIPPPTTVKSIMYNNRNMMKHLRPRTSLTSFARHVASDLFTREEIMAKLHVDHNNERDIFLRHCICTAWNLTEQQLYSMWPKIRNALLQLRRDAIAGKCIRMNSKRQQSSGNNLQPCNNSDYEDDDESQNKSDLYR